MSVIATALLLHVTVCFPSSFFSHSGRLYYVIVAVLGNFNIGIKHGFSCINIRQVPWEVLKTEAEGEC